MLQLTRKVELTPDVAHGFMVGLRTGRRTAGEKVPEAQCAQHAAALVGARHRPPSQRTRWSTELPIKRWNDAATLARIDADQRRALRPASGGHSGVPSGKPGAALTDGDDARRRARGDGPDRPR